MKSLLITALLILSTQAFSFEDGAYHGTAVNQACDIDLSQKANSLVINNLYCVDNALGVETSIDAGTEFPIGHMEDVSEGYHYVLDVTADSYNFVATNIRSGDVIRESIKKVSSGKVHYSLSVSEMQNIFDMDLSK